MKRLEKMKYSAPEVELLQMSVVEHLLVSMSLDGVIEDPDFSGEEF